MPTTRILAIDDDQSMLDLVRYHLDANEYEIFVAASGTAGLGLLDARRFDLVLADLHLPDIDGIDLITRIKATAPDTEIVIVSGYGSVLTAVEAIKAGAFFFVEKPVDFDELSRLIEKALERHRQADEINRLRGKLANRDTYYSLIGGSKAMQDIYETIESVAESDANVLIHGESGTGKELVANAIHYRSTRSAKNFMKVNCAALPRELMESELFGHTRGAFTGATHDKIGIIGQANGGSLLMDEIGEMPIELQPKLMRVLQERVYTKIGSEKPLATDFRLIAATNRDPREAIEQGYLRKDLYYRINTIEIRVPPLRERPEDIQHLTESFLADFAARYHRPARIISPSAYARLFAYPWPGNVRELKNSIERAVLLSKGDTIEIGHLPFGGVEPCPPLPSADWSLERIGHLLVSRLPDANDEVGHSDFLREVEWAIVSAALERTKGNKQATANLLGLYRPRLYTILRKHNQTEDVPEDAPDDAPDDGGDPENGKPDANTQWRRGIL